MIVTQFRGRTFGGIAIKIQDRDLGTVRREQSRRRQANAAGAGRARNDCDFACQKHLDLPDHEVLSGSESLS